jgi:hypothetical protein
MKIRPGLDPMLTDWNKPFLPELGGYIHWFQLSTYLLSAGSGGSGHYYFYFKNLL